MEGGGARFGGAPIVFAAAGAAHSGAVTSAGVVFTWGEAAIIEAPAIAEA